MDELNKEEANKSTVNENLHQLDQQINCSNLPKSTQQQLHQLANRGNQFTNQYNESLSNQLANQQMINQQMANQFNQHSETINSHSQLMDQRKINFNQNNQMNNQMNNYQANYGQKNYASNLNKTTNLENEMVCEAINLTKRNEENLVDDKQIDNKDDFNEDYIDLTHDSETFLNETQVNNRLNNQINNDLNNSLNQQQLTQSNLDRSKSTSNIENMNTPIDSNSRISASHSKNTQSSNDKHSSEISSQFSLSSLLKSSSLIHTPLFKSPIQMTKEIVIENTINQTQLAYAINETENQLQPIHLENMVKLIEDSALNELNNGKEFDLDKMNLDDDLKFYLKKLDDLIDIFKSIFNVSEVMKSQIKDLRQRMLFFESKFIF